MTPSCNCTHCPAFRILCAGCTEPCRYRECDGQCAACPVRCHRHSSLDQHLAAIGGLDLDLSLRPQPPFRLARYFPQLTNGLELRSPLQRMPDVAVGIAKILTPAGRVSKRALPRRPGPFNLRAQWGLSEISRLICIGNDKDERLERLWAAQLKTTDPAGDPWMQVRVLGFEFATSLNFSIYLDEPRLEHLISIKRTWLTVARMQQTSTLIAIPHLQWGTLWDLERQLDYARAQGFHTLTLNLQIAKRQAWQTIEPGLQLIREQAPELRLLFTGVVSLRRLASLAGMFPTASFTSVTPHYLAQRHVQYQRDGTRLIKQPVDGHVDLILAENVRLYQDFLAGLNGHGPTQPRLLLPSEQALITACRDVTTLLQTRLSQSAVEAAATVHRLSADRAILEACRVWLQAGKLDRTFQGSFPTWPCAESVPQPTLGQLLDRDPDPLRAFLHLAGLAEQVDQEIEILAGQAGI
jgi:hypothetical protein